MPFLGSGFSKQADPKHFPNWTELLTRMVKEAEHLGYIKRCDAKDLIVLLTKGNSLMVGESLKEKLPTDFYVSFLQHQFDPNKDISPSEAHKLVFKLNPRFIITTNYDHLVEDAYAHIERKTLTVMNYQTASLVQRRLQDDEHTQKPFLFKIHGDIELPSSIILTETDYRRLQYDEHGYKALLSSIFIHYVVLMMGFSLRDQEILLHLSHLRHALKGEQDPDYVLLADNSVTYVEIERFRKDFGLMVLQYPTDRTHSGVASFLRALVRSAK